MEMSIIIMNTEKIIVKETAEENIDRIIEIERSNSEFIGQYDFEGHHNAIQDSDCRHLSIFDRSDDNLVGYIILFGLNDPNDAIEFRRIAISRKRLGFGKDAVQIVKTICFSELKKHRLHLSVFSDNSNAIKLYEALGFVKEGLIRDCIKSGDIYRSLWKMSMLDSEFR